MMEKRGGAKNYQKGNIDIEHLTDGLANHVKTEGPLGVFDFGEYKSLGANHAVRGPALAKIGTFIMSLLDVKADACITYSDLKAAVANVTLKFPEVKANKQQDVQGFAGEVADRCMVILKHCRAMSLGDNSETIWKRCTCHVPHYLMPVMHSIRQKIKQSAMPTKRELVAHHSTASALSVDEFGLPSLKFAGGSSCPELDTDSLAEEAEMLGIVPPTKDLLKSEMGIKKKPSCSSTRSCKKPAAKKKHLKSTSSKSGAMKIPHEGIQQSSLKMHGPFQHQSYITHMKPPKLVVACSSKQSTDHYKVIQQVFSYIKKTPHSSKEAAIEYRNKLLNRH
jgi:hypothetical protein